MQVIFIHHSCFLVEVDEKVLIFDWFAGDRVNGYTFGGQIPEYEPDTPIYVQATSTEITLTWTCSTGQSVTATYIIFFQKTAGCHLIFWKNTGLTCLSGN